MHAAMTCILCTSYGRVYLFYDHYLFACFSFFFVKKFLDLSYVRVRGSSDDLHITVLTDHCTYV